MVDYLYSKTDSFVSPEIANYEDRIITDEVKKRMDNMVLEAENQGLNVISDYFGSKRKDVPEPQVSLDKGNAFTKSLGIPSNTIMGNYYFQPETNTVNVPRTPTLFNLFGMGEEIEHGLNSLPQADINNRAYFNSQRYEEEKRAKQASLDRMGGLLPPESKRAAKITMDTYRDEMADKALAEQFGYDTASNKKEKYGNFSNDVLSIDSDYVSPEDQMIYNYWNEKEIKPVDYFKMIYPELEKKLSK
jgi:hypothetical protein